MAKPRRAVASSLAEAKLARNAGGVPKLERNPKGSPILGAEQGDTVRGLGWPELVIILVVVVVLFGATRLPMIARSIGTSAREFRKGMDDGAEEEGDGDASDKNS